MSTFSRRDFVKGGSMAAVAAGLATMIPASAAGGTSANSRTDVPDPTRGSRRMEGVRSTAAIDAGLVARVVNPDTGEIDIFYGDHEVKYRDRELARRLLRAANARPISAPSGRPAVSRRLAP
jgi:hypothetical protein